LQELSIAISGVGSHRFGLSSLPCRETGEHVLCRHRLLTHACGGWELPATCGAGSYYLCMSGNADNSGRDEGEWHIIVEKRRSIWERLTGRGKIAADDPLARAVEEILAKEATIRNVRREG
jgi:hypothetical protein